MSIPIVSARSRISSSKWLRKISITRIKGCFSFSSMCFIWCSRIWT
jgi:hypothetical protein